MVKIFIAILVLFLPAVLLVTILPINEYTDQRINALDCDGSFAVLILSIPIYLLYGIGFIFFAKKYLKNTIRSYLILPVLCFIVLAAITPNTLGAIHEQSRVDGELNCEARYSE